MRPAVTFAGLTPVGSRKGTVEGSARAGQLIQVVSLRENEP